MGNALKVKMIPFILTQYMFHELACEWNIFFEDALNTSGLCALLEPNINPLSQSLNFIDFYIFTAPYFWVFVWRKQKSQKTRINGFLLFLVLFKGFWVCFPWIYITSKIGALRAPHSLALRGETFSVRPILCFGTVSWGDFQHIDLRWYALLSWSSFAYTMAFECYHLTSASGQQSVPLASLSLSILFLTEEELQTSRPYLSVPHH